MEKKPEFIHDHDPRISKIWASFFDGTCEHYQCQELRNTIDFDRLDHYFFDILSVHMNHSRWVLKEQ